MITHDFTMVGLFIRGISEGQHLYLMVILCAFVRIHPGLWLYMSFVPM